MSFSRIIIQLLKTLNPLSTFRIVFRYDFINEHSWSPSTSPEGSDGNHNHTFLPRKRRNHVRTSLLIKFTWRIRLLAIIEEIQRSLIISNATLLITDGRLDFHFHTVFLSDTPPSIYNANPRLMTPPRSVTRELLKKWLNSEKMGSPKMSVRHWPIFGVTRTGLKIMHPKSGLRLVLLTDPDWLQKIAKKYLPCEKKCWLEMGTFGLRSLTSNWHFFGLRTKVVHRWYDPYQTLMVLTAPGQPWVIQAWVSKLYFLAQPLVVVVGHIATYPIHRSGVSS